MSEGSYLSGSPPSRTEGSYGPTKQQPGLKWGKGLLQIVADEVNRALDDLISIWKTVGAQGSTDPRSHEYRLDELEKVYPGFDEEFVGYSGVAASIYLDDIGGTGSVANTWSDAVGVGKVQAVAATETGWGGADGVFDMQSTEVQIRHTISSLPSTAGDILRIGLWKDSNNYVMFHSTRTAGGFPAWTVEVMSGGVSQGSQVLTASPDSVPDWHTFKIITTGTTARFIYDEGETGEEDVTLTATPPSVMADPRTTVTSNSGGEDHYTDYVRCHSTEAYT